MAHGSAYATLAFLLELSFRRTSHKWPLYRRHLLVFGLVALFGATDEIHQSFIPGRESDIRDWIADSMGACVGLALASLPFLWSRNLQVFSWWRGRSQRPDPERPLLLVADTHWDDDISMLHEWTREFPDADWLFLGDIFETWIGLRKMETSAQREFLEWAIARRKEGRWIGFWMGNREFFLDVHSEVFSMMGEGVGGELPGEGLRFEHGDLICCQDTRYRLWSLIINSGPVWLFAKLLPAGMAGRLAAFLRRKLGSGQRIYKSRFPQAAFEKAAKGDGCFVSGHFHVFMQCGSGVSLPFAGEGRFMVWRSGTWNIYFSENSMEGETP